jgi:arylsulfatase A-like enzyme
VGGPSLIEKGRLTLPAMLKQQGYATAAIGKWHIGLTFRDQAGEAIHAWTIAIRSGLKIGAMAQYVAPYPTLGEAGKRAAGSFYTASLFGPRVKRLVRFLAGLPG